MILTGLGPVNIALVGSRWKRPVVDRPFRVPLVPLVPALGVVASLLLLIDLERRRRREPPHGPRRPRRASGLARGRNTRTLVEPTDESRQAFLDQSESADIVVIGSTGGRDEDVNVSGAVLRRHDAPTLVVQSGSGNVHRSLF